MTPDHKEAFRREGWNACRKSIYAVCEDVQHEADEAAKHDGEHAKGYAAGMARAAKSIARGFNSMEATDDDHFRALAASQPAPAPAVDLDAAVKAFTDALKESRVFAVLEGMVLKLGSLVEGQPAPASETDHREVLFFASYCGDDNEDCTEVRPCKACLGMSNVYSIPAGTPIKFRRSLCPEWNVDEPAADTLHGPYGYLIMPEGLAEDEWYLADDPEAGAASEPLYAKREIPLGKPAPAADTGQAVAWMHPGLGWAHRDYDYVKAHCWKKGPYPVPLYTHPAPLDAEHVREDDRDRMYATAHGRLGTLDDEAGYFSNACEFLSDEGAMLPAARAALRQKEGK